MTPEELEDITQARMKNWIRPSYWVEQVKKLGQPKAPRERRDGDERAPRAYGQEEPGRRAEAAAGAAAPGVDMALVRRVAKLQAASPGENAVLEDADKQAILAFMRQLRQ